MPQSPDWARLTLPSDDREAWAATAGILQSCREALDGAAGLAAIDAAITAFAKSDPEPRVCSFFATYGRESHGAFDFERFRERGAPFLFQVALEMPELFASTTVPIFKLRSACDSSSPTLGEACPRQAAVRVSTCA